jgi:predicted secreted protein
MAQPTTIRGTQLLIKVGDGASPEVFTHPCLINTERGIQFQSQGADVVVPDCATPEDPAWLEHVKDGLSATITGAGTLNITDVDEFDAWFRDPDPKNVQVWLGTHGYWQGAFHLTEFQVTGTRTEKAQCNISLRSEGVVPAFVPQP